MFLSWVQIGSYRVGSIRVGSFRVRVYSGRFRSVPVLSGKINLDPKGNCKFSVRFRVGFFLVGSGSSFQVQVKMPMPIWNINKGVVSDEYKSERKQKIKT